MTVQPVSRAADWRDLARCRDTDPELFFPIGSSGPGVTQTEQAVRVCHRCSVTQACLNFALEHHQDAGVWGGTTEEQRRSLLRSRSTTRVGSPRG